MSGAWALFRLDMRRTWTWVCVAMALAVLGGVFAVQGVVTRAAIGVAFSPYGWAYDVALYFGLISGYWHPRFYPPTTMTTSWDDARGWCAIAGAAIQFLMPAFTAGAFAADRQSGRLGDLALTRLRPLALFLAKGMAAVLPFLALSATASLVLAWGYLRAQAAGDLPTAAPGMMRAGLLHFLLGTPSVAGILLVVAARCRHLRQAMLVCYGVSMGVLPLLDLELIHAMLTHDGSSLHAPHPALLQAALLALLLPWGLHALRHPEPG